MLFIIYRWGKPQPLIYQGNAEGASLPAIASRSAEASGTLPQISRRKDHALILSSVNRKKYLMTIRDPSLLCTMQKIKCSN
ncbi:MAG: hypothetical protein JRJ45_03045 [Deltaproteobacteria bacterium]|nr:hypothetical protein [Deltaproteobacteria bacterium]